MHTMTGPLLSYDGVVHQQLFVNMHHVHAGKVSQPGTLVTNLSADAGLQQQAMLELLQLCRDNEKCSPSLMTECIAQGGVEVNCQQFVIYSRCPCILATHGSRYPFHTLATHPSCANSF